MANPFRGLVEVLTQIGLHPNRVADIIRMAEADPALANKLMEAAQADDFGKSLRTLAVDSQWGRAPARPPRPQDIAPAPLTTAQRMMANPDIQSQIQSNMDRLPPALAQRIQSGDADAAMEAYSMIAQAEGELPLRTLDNVPPPAGRQMELPLGEPEQPPTGLIPFGVRGQGVPVGGPTGSGVLVGEPVSPGVPIYPMTAFGRAISDPRRAMGGFPSQYNPGPARIGTTAWTPFRGAPPARGIIPHPGMGGPRGLVISPPRTPEPTSLRDLATAGIAAAAAGAGGYMAGKSIPGMVSELSEGTPGDAVAAPDIGATDEPIALTSEGTADLAAETTPPPGIAAQEESPAWRRVIDEGHIALGDATPSEIAQAHQRIGNMVRMGVDRNEAYRRAYDGLGDAVVARARQQAEAWLKAHPDF